METALILAMPYMTSDALAVFVYLDDRSRQDTKIGITQQELSRATAVGVNRIRQTLGWLEDPQVFNSGAAMNIPINPFIRVDKYSKAHKITMLQPFVDTERWLRFTFEDTDARRIATLEQEVRRLSTTTADRDKLSTFLLGDAQITIAEIEADLGRPLTKHEAFLLGECNSYAGPERIRAAWRRHAASMKNPILGISALFKKQYLGKASKKEVKEEKEVGYLQRDTEPV